MKKFISRDKLSKKARRALDQEKRGRWAVPPLAKIIPNKKKNAQAKSHPEKDETGWDFFLAISERFNAWTEIDKTA